MQEGGDVKSKAAETNLAELPARATGTRPSLILVMGLTPSEGMTRLLVAPNSGDDHGREPMVFKQRITNLVATTACPPILF